MGLDQYLTLEITTDHKEYPIKLAKQYFKDINNYLSNIGYSAELNYWEESDNPTYTLDDLYDIVGELTGNYSFANIKNIQQDLRKANQIQNYFETKFYSTNPDETYNCIDTVLDDADVDILLNKINLIMSQPTMEDKQRYAKRLLPTVEGFFYGSTDYDQDYFDDIASFSEQLQYLSKLRNQIDHVMTDSPFSVELIYSSWWWSHANPTRNVYYRLYSLSTKAKYRCNFVCK